MDEFQLCLEGKCQGPAAGPVLVGGRAWRGGHGGGPVVVGGRVWPRCPTVIMSEAAPREVIRHLNEADISPLAGWPDAYAAWLVEGMREVQAHQAQRIRHDSQRKKSGGGALSWL